jgi:hypothetical protein
MGPCVSGQKSLTFFPSCTAQIWRQVATGTMWLSPGMVDTKAVHHSLSKKLLIDLPVEPHERFRIGGDESSSSCLIASERHCCLDPTSVTMDRSPTFSVVVVILGTLSPFTNGFQPLVPQQTTRSSKYDARRKKKQTLADQAGGTKDFSETGLVGRVPFRQGKETEDDHGLAKQPLRAVASQVGLYIKHGCGKGECRIYEALVNGKWVRRYSVVVPSMAPGEEYVVQVKEVKNKAESSGKLYSVRSFLFGFYNNVLGMVGLVMFRRTAKKNVEERREYDDLIKQKAREKMMQRM